MYELIRLAVPVAAAHLANMTMQLVDTIFVGRLGAQALGGMSVGNAAFAMVMITGLGMMFGLDYLMSYAYGAGRQQECNRLLVQAVYLAVGISIPLVAFMYVIGGFFSHIGIDASVLGGAKEYLRAVCWSLIPFLAFTAFRQYLQAMGIAAPMLWILVVGNVINAVGNWVFVYGHLGVPKLGVAGAGYATCVGRLVMLFMAVGYVLWRNKRFRLGLEKTSFAFSLKKIVEVVKLGAPAAAQVLLEVGAFAGATFFVGRLGAIPTATHQIVLNIASFTFMVPLGISSAAAVRVGQALGAGHRFKAIRTGWNALVLGAGFMACCGVGLYLTGPRLMRIFTEDAAVIAMGSSILLIAAFFQLFDGVQVVATGVLRGTGDTRSSMLANLFGHWGLGLPVGFTLCFYMGSGVWGLWIGLSIGLTAVALALLGVWWVQAKKMA